MSIEDDNIVTNKDRKDVIEVVYASETELPKAITAIMDTYLLDVVGVRGTCSANEQVTSIDGLTVLTPAQIVRRGHERVDRETFQVTRFERGGKIHPRSLKWAKASTKDIRDLLGGLGIDASVSPTFIVYHPEMIYTTSRISPVMDATRVSLLGIPRDYYRADMKLDASSQAVLGIVVLR